MRNAIFGCLVVLSLGIPARQAHSSPYKQADAYYEVRDRAQLAESFTPEEIQTQPKKFEGKLIEVRGIINATVGSDAQTTIMLEGTPDAQGLVITLPAGKRMSSWTFLDVGISFRGLCKVVTQPGGDTGSLELVIPVKEFEAAQVDQSRAKLLAEKQKQEQIRKALAERKKTTSPALASRGIGRTVTRGATGGRAYSDSELVAVYASAVHYFNHRISPDESRTIAKIIIDHSRKYGLDARLVMAVIAVESNFNSSAVSPVGAMGLGQLMPGTASDLGVGNAFSVKENLDGSTRLLSGHIRNMQADGRPTDEAVKLALACYNAGAGAVKKYKGIPPYRETQAYVAKITRLYQQMCGRQ